MNGLSLRISSGAKKSKNIISLPPVVIKNHPDNATENEWIKTVLKSETTDAQLSILKKELETLKDPVDTNIVKLLVVIFFHAEAKHPVKCFLARHVTKNKHIQETFVELLTSEITMHLGLYGDDNGLSYQDTVSKIGMCLENFSAGTLAVDGAAEKLIEYLLMVLHECCTFVVEGNFRYKDYSPTKKNTIFSLAHSALKILLYIITKTPLNLDLHQYFDDVPHVKQVLRNHQLFMKVLFQLLNDKEVPMDTKSLCGLVLLSCDQLYHHCPDNDDSWKHFLERNNIDEKKDEVQLACYSAIITTVPIQNLQDKENCDKLAPISVIVQKLMDIVERNAMEGVLVLGAARALLAVGAGLARLRPGGARALPAALLGFVWPHLDHYMDSVRHLAAQILTAVVKYCASLEEHDPECGALSPVLEGVTRLGVSRRGYYAGVRGCAAALGARAVLRSVAPLPRLLAALPLAHVSATAAGTLDALLGLHAQQTEARVVHDEWLVPILRFVQTRALSPEVLTILENLLTKAVKLDPKLSAYILPHIKQACEAPDYDLKNVLVLLSVTRGSLARIPDDDNSQTQELWGGVLPYEILEEAVVDAQDEVRLAGLALTCGGGAGGCTRGELRVLLHYLAHCGDEPDAHVRQKALAILDKFVKRLVAGFRAALRNGDEGKSAMYREFVEQLRAHCYGALQRAASHARRAFALQLLRTLEPRPLDPRIWKPDYVDKLLQHLDDSYETNKAMALEILQHAPLELLKDTDHSVSLKLDDIVRQAGALKPTECVSAAYKLELLCRRLPDNILRGRPSDVPEAAVFTAIHALLRSLRHVDYVLLMPRDCPAYGVLHCVAHLLARLQPESIRNCQQWNQLLSFTTIAECDSLLTLAGQVVNTVAPEGAMPRDCQYTDYGNNAGVVLDDGRIVTAQMVLLCAWRTVKEATAVLSVIGAQFSKWHEQVQLARRLGGVLGAARHRGAFEQAYVAYARVLHSIWRGEETRRWAAQALADMLTSLGALTHTADRRSAGLPFLVQALVSTEENAGGPSSALHGVMNELLRLADADADAGAEAGAEAEAAANRRAHACNILRTLYRDSSLESAVQSYVGEGLRVSLKGFERATWAERNSSTLLLSALVTRVFGVTRARAGAGLSARNRMTGRVFYLRYPHLYDVMLNKLKEASESEEKLLLCPSLYPVLLLLGRLYPSSLEGTESNLKLVSFVPYVVSCARSRVLLTRRLAAGACVALVPPDRYVAHVQYLLSLVSDAGIARNYCHGLLLQICALLEHKPARVACGALDVTSTLWVLRQRPMCYPVLQQYVLMLTTMLDRFSEALRRAPLEGVAARLRALLAAPGGAGGAEGAGGRELALAACLRLLLRLTTGVADVADLILGALQHEVHAVSAAALDCLLALHGRRGAEGGADLLGEDAEGGADENAVLEENVEIEVEVQANNVEAEVKVGAEAEAVLCELRNRPRYLPSLVDALKSEELWRCDPQRVIKYLEIIVAEGGTQKLVTSVPPPDLGYRTMDSHAGRELFGLIQILINYCGIGPHCCTQEVAAMKRYARKSIVSQLQDLIHYGPEAATHLYVESLVRYVVDHMESLSPYEWQCALDGLVGSARGRRAGAARLLRGLRAHAARLLRVAAAAEPHVAFMIESFVFVSLAVLLRAPAAGTRALAARAALPLTAQGSARVPVARRCGALLLRAARTRERALPLLLHLALYPAPPPPPPPRHDDAASSHRRDECRVFDGELENVYDEKRLWTIACADEVVELCAQEGVEPLTQVVSCAEKWNFCYPMRDLKAAADGHHVEDPHVKVFINRLQGKI